MAKPRKTLSGSFFIQGKPKRVAQGNSKNSKPSHGRKKRRGQGK